MTVSYIRDSEEPEFQHSGNRPFELIPRGGVVSQPVPRVLPRPRKSRP